MLNTNPGAKFYCDVCKDYCDIIGSHDISVSSRAGYSLRICPNCWKDIVNEYWAEYDAMNKEIRDKYWAEIDALRRK